MSSVSVTAGLKVDQGIGERALAGDGEFGHLYSAFLTGKQGALFTFKSRVQEVEAAERPAGRTMPHEIVLGPGPRVLTGQRSKWRVGAHGSVGLCCASSRSVGFAIKD